jgi:hypothetical protein
VILFDQLWSMTEFVQSRGRARDRNSQLIIVSSQGERKAYETLIETEKKLIQLIQPMIKNKSHLKTKILKALNQQIFQQKSSNNDNDNQSKKRTYYYEDIKFFLQVYFNNNEEKMNLFRRLRTCSGFVQTDKARKSYISLDIFDQMKIVNCLFELKNNRSKIDKSKFVINTISYLLKGGHQAGIYWFKSRTKNALSTCNVQLMCKELRLGNLVSPFKFLVQSSNSIENLSYDLENVKLIINYEKRCLFILMFIDGQLHKLEVPFESIDQLICVDNSDENLISVYLPTNRPPICYIININDLKVSPSDLANLDEAFIPWRRVCLAGLDWTYFLRFENANKYELISSLDLINECRVLFCPVNLTTTDFTISDLRSNFRWLPFSTYYLVEAFLSQCGYLLNGRIDQTFIKMIRNLDDTKLERVLSKLSSNLINNRFIDFYEELKQLIKRNFVAPLEITNPNVELMKLATITPSRVIFHFPEPSFSNRVTRQYGCEHFLRLKFCDEDMRKLNMARNYADMTLVYERIRRILADGIQIQSRLYEFFAMSSSQLREHGCWLFCKLNNVDAQSARDWLGNFSSIRCVGKYAARLGQSLSSSVGTFESNNVIMIDDIEYGTYCFTDGIGKISKQKALEISRTHFKLDDASAFQIRFGGYKGVVAVDLNLINYELVFRKSMKKFDSGHNRLDVLNVAKHVDCYLNRQVIIILSALGVPDSVFINLQDEMLNELSSMFTDCHIAYKYIQAYFRSTFSFSRNNPTLNYSLEPFFRSLLKIIYYKTMEDLIKKSRIYVKVKKKYVLIFGFFLIFNFMFSF